MEKFQFYAEKEVTNDGVIYQFFEPSILGLRMYGTKKKDIVKVEVEENQTDTESIYWGFYEMNKNQLNYLFPSKSQVEICSPDRFKREVEKGLGRYVNLIVRELDMDVVL